MPMSKDQNKNLHFWNAVSFPATLEMAKRVCATGQFRWASRPETAAYTVTKRASPREGSHSRWATSASSTGEKRGDLCVHLFIGKDPDAGEDWRQGEKGITEDEMVGWHHRLNGRECEQTPEDGERQGSLACSGPWGRKESHTTEWPNNNKCAHRPDRPPLGRLRSS